MAFDHTLAGIAQATQQFSARGWTPAAAGNFSVKLGNQIWISESGVYKGQITPEQFMQVDTDGHALDTPQARSTQKPSAETELHCQLYQQYPEVKSVLHTHSVASTVLSMHLASMQALPLRGYEVLKAFAHISDHDSSLLVPIFDNSQTMADIAQAFSRWQLAHPRCCAYIIRGHGIYTWAESLDTAVRQIEALEFLLECELQRLQLT